MIYLVYRPWINNGNSYFGLERTMKHARWGGSLLIVVVLLIMTAGCQSKQPVKATVSQSVAAVKLTKDFKFDKNKTAYYVEGLQGEKDSPVSIPNTYYYTYGMKALGRDIKKSYKDQLISFIKASQKNDGGFGWDKSATNSDTFDTFCAMWALSRINALGEIDLVNVEKFISSCANKDGGYAFAPGQSSTLPHTYYSVAALDMLGKSSSNSSTNSSSINRSAVIAYIDGLKGTHGGYAVRAHTSANAQSTYAALRALEKLDALDTVDKEKTISFLEKDKTRDGGYGYMVGELAAPIPENVFYVLSSLRILDATDKVKPATLSKFLRDRYVFDGGFCDIYYGNSQYPTTYYGIGSLVALGQLANPEAAN